MLHGLDLFSGIGGIGYALKDYVKTVAYCEIGRYQQAVLLSLMEDKKIQQCPIWDDVKTFPSDTFKGHIDIIFAGFPCQDISVAGHGIGLEGKRSRLFFEIMRISEKIKPSFIFLENVSAIISRDGLRVVTEIAKIGYDCRWCTLSAASVGAHHKRDRWFLLAHSRRFSKGRSEDTKKPSLYASRCCWERETEPKMDRVVDDVPYRVDRIKSLGNSVVPRQAKVAFETLMGLNTIGE
jgi:DNA (cytosine-5)-methyltransferase 1